MQLIAGRTAQEYNQRKMRQGAFWEDRYQEKILGSGLLILNSVFGERKRGRETFHVRFGRPRDFIVDSLSTNDSRPLFIRPNNIP